MAGDQKWEMAESTIGIIFLFEIQIHYFLYIQGIFKSHLKKIIPLKIPIWPKFLLYKPEKWLTISTNKNIDNKYMKSQSQRLAY